jgi:hypothetical protein
MAETESAYTLNKVRTLKNYGLYVTGLTVDPIFKYGVLNSKPNILINGSTCTIDYSHVYSNSDAVYLRKTFNAFSGGGETFTISPSEYFDEYNSVTTTLSGTCRISSVLNDGKIIVSKIISGMTAESDYNYYGKDNFLNTPQYSFTTTGGTIGCFLVNSLPNLSVTTFNDMGILGSIYGFEEYIEISGGTADNAERILVNGTTTLKDSREILYFAAGGTFQNFSNTVTTVDLYLRGKPSLLTAPYNTNVTGIFTILNASNSNLEFCFENQTINQSELRRVRLPSVYNSNFVDCKSCYDLIYGTEIGTDIYIITPAFTNLLYLTVTSPISAVLASANNLNITTTTITQSVTLNRSFGNNIFKIDLSHPSLIGYDLAFYSDAGYNVSLGPVYNRYGIPGYNGAYAMINPTPVSTTIYGILTGQSTIYFNIKT